MVEHEHTCTEGISLLINMKDWNHSRSNYNFFYQLLMKIMREYIPIRLRSIHIIYPPTWMTNKLWLLRPMLASYECKDHIYMIHHEDELSNYFMSNYQSYLPDDIVSGQINTDDLVRDYVIYCRYIEQQRCSMEYQHHDDEEEHHQHQHQQQQRQQQQQDNDANLKYHDDIPNKKTTTLDNNMIQLNYTINKQQQHSSLHYTSKKTRGNKDSHQSNITTIFKLKNNETNGKFEERNVINDLVETLSSRPRMGEQVEI
jgi:CRAL/TRIO domain